MPPKCTATLPDVCGGNILIIGKRNGIIVAYDAHCLPEDPHCCPKEIIGGHALRARDIATNDWILSEGDTVYWCNGKYKNDRDFAEVTFKAAFMACSGYSVLQKGGGQQYEGLGPTVEGEYELDLTPGPGLAKTAIDKYGDLVLTKTDTVGIQSIPKKFKETWGKKRIRLQPKVVSPPMDEYGNKTRDISSFYFHNSGKGYTAGCTDVESAFFDTLERYRAKMVALKKQVIKIKVIVKYPSENHATKHILYDENKKRFE